VINHLAQPCDEGLIRSVPFAHECGKAQKNWILAGTILGSSMAFIDSSVVNIALPAIEKDFATLALSSQAKQAIENARGKFVTEPIVFNVPGEDRRIVQSVITDSLAESLRRSMLLAAMLAFAGSLWGAFAIRTAARHRRRPRA